MPTAIRNIIISHDGIHIMLRSRNLFMNAKAGFFPADSDHMMPFRMPDNAAMKIMSMIIDTIRNMKNPLIVDESASIPAGGAGPNRAPCGTGSSPGRRPPPR